MPAPIIGRQNTLRAIAEHDSGILLDGGPLGDILLPNRYIPPNFTLHEELEVFLSFDSEDRLIATTEKPLVMAGEFALLRVVATTRIGAFLDWGMPKDLLLPFAEQVRRLEVGGRELVHVRLDEVSNRLVASAKLRKFLGNTAPAGKQGGDKVHLITKPTLGRKPSSTTNTGVSSPRASNIPFPNLVSPAPVTSPASKTTASSISPSSLPATPKSLPPPNNSLPSFKPPKTASSRSTTKVLQNKFAPNSGCPKTPSNKP
jgi:hypothetical protein